MKRKSINVGFKSLVIIINLFCSLAYAENSAVNSVKNQSPKAENLTVRKKNALGIADRDEVQKNLRRRASQLYGTSSRE